MFGTGCDRVQGAPPPNRDLVIERVSKITKDNKKKLKFGSYNCKRFGVDKYVIMPTFLVACDFFVDTRTLYVKFANHV